jgi:hypothetical protein
LKGGNRRKSYNGKGICGTGLQQVEEISQPKRKQSRELRRVVIHISVCILTHLLNALTAVMLGRPELVQKLNRDLLIDCEAGTLPYRAGSL